MIKRFTLKAHIAAATLMLAQLSVQAQDIETLAADSISDGGKLEEVHVIGTAQDELRQAPGVSTITSTDLERRPPVNDISEVLRTMPGVNLTGNSASGQRGNNRQIDIRGMGPENTLILIDGKPVSSRNSVRYGWRGERDTRGDTNWVAPQEIERIDVLRGPAAARYGTGAAGGVVNIITKRNAEKLSGSISLYTNQPEHSDEGDTRRATFSLSGPISDRLSFRLSGNVNKTDSDSPNINKGHRALDPTITNYAAGREGVRNRDIAGRLSWTVLQGHTLDFDASFSRQGNIYTGDTQNNNKNVLVEENLGSETNRLYRQNYSLTYNGQYDFGAVMGYLQYGNTRNTRINEGLAGGTEGIFNTSNIGFSTNELEDYTAHLETHIPMNTAGFSHVLTIGGEFGYSKLTDPNSVTQGHGGGAIAGMAASDRSDKATSDIWSIFIEDNLELTDRTILTPGLRFDYHSKAGSNWSPAINISHYLTDNITIKAGVARAYKAPNLYQTNDNYLLYSRGNGCWGGNDNGCYLLGNSDLKAETSINQELGIEYRNENNFMAGLTYFRNDYRNKISSGITPIGLTGTAKANTNIYQWENVPKAVVEGFEGSINIPLASNLNWGNNFTYMLTSKNKQTGERLSITPEYTISTTLDWQINADWNTQATFTYFGRQKPARLDSHGKAAQWPADIARGSYGLLGLSTGYTINKNLQFTVGVSNLLDKRLYRRGNASAAGAETYNEPGRSYFILLTNSF